jgi:glycosyltransferase involved in cell wall biosynthesis
VTFVEPTDDVERYFRAADIFILPSVREAHPLALLEAMACGLPVVATRLPGATDVVIDDGRNGRLFPPDDEGALRAVLDELLADPASALEMGRRAHETVSSRYDIQRTADAWLDAYHAVLTNQ